MLLPFAISLEDLQPTQAWVNADDLAIALDSWDPLAVMGPAPPHVLEVEGQWVLLDGHARAVSALVRGRDPITVMPLPAVREPDRLATLLAWTRAEGVWNVTQLFERVVPPPQFVARWQARVDELDAAADTADRSEPQSDPDAEI